MMKMPSNAAMKIGMARAAVSSVMALIGLVEAVFIWSPFSPSTRGRGLALRRRQVSWLAGLSLPSAFPGRMRSSGRLGEARRLQLRGQPRHWAFARTAFPSHVPPHAGTDDAGDYSGGAGFRKEQRGAAH
jgi:hypothetical protein